MMNDTHYAILVVHLSTCVRTIIMSDVSVIAEYKFSHFESLFGVLQCSADKVYELACFSAGNCTLIVMPPSSNMISGVEVHYITFTSTVFVADLKMVIYEDKIYMMLKDSYVHFISFNMSSK